jgi:hypothetical protein
MQPCHHIAHQFGKSTPPSSIFLVGSFACLAIENKHWMAGRLESEVDQVVALVHFAGTLQNQF